MKCLKKEKMTDNTQNDELLSVVVANGSESKSKGTTHMVSQTHHETKAGRPLEEKRTQPSDAYLVKHSLSSMEQCYV